MTWLGFLERRVTKTTLDFINLDMKFLVNIAKWFTPIVDLLFGLVFVEAVMKQLQKRLHKFCSISFGIQSKFFNLLLAIKVFKQLPSEVLGVKQRPLNFDF